MNFNTLPKMTPQPQPPVSSEAKRNHKPLIISVAVIVWILISISLSSLSSKISVGGNESEYTTYLNYNVEILDIDSDGARVQLSNGNDIFIKGLGGYSGRWYNLSNLKFKNIGSITYTTVMGSSRRIPAYEVWND